MGAGCAQVRMDEYEVIKCINFIRTCVSQGKDPRSELAGAVSTPVKPWKDDSYLIPVLPDDAMLFHEFGSSMDVLPASPSRSGPVGLQGRIALFTLCYAKSLQSTASIVMRRLRCMCPTELSFALPKLCGTGRSHYVTSVQARGDSSGLTGRDRGAAAEAGAGPSEAGELRAAQCTARGLPVHAAA